MHIHKVKKGETVYSIAREYGISPAKIIENNGLKKPDRLAIGRELLILIPTRTYTARSGDTLELISKRFSVSRSELMKNNPALLGTNKIYPEEVFAVKYPEKSHGIALLNGYLYKGCPRERLSLTLPYLSHLTLSSCVYERGRLGFLFDTKEARELAKSAEKSLALRIYCRPPYIDTAFDERFIAMATDAAKKQGCGLVTLSAQKMTEDEKFSDFLFGMKKALMSEGLGLLIETDGRIAEKCIDTADSIILNADECSLEKPIDSMKKSEEAYRDFAAAHDSSKAFIDLSPFAYKGNEAVPIENMLEHADRGGIEILEECDGMLLKFKADKEECVMPSLKSIKAKLDLIGELGYLGCSIDIMRCPMSHLMMLSSLFHLSPDYFSGGI